MPINVGIAGMGFMGVTHFRGWAPCEHARVAAISTRNPKKLAGDWSTVKGNFGDAGGDQDLSNIATYATFDELVADDSLDLIDICLPTAMHVDTTLRALESGKHVLVEKPIAIDIADATRMVDAARASGRQLMVAHVLRFWPEFSYLKSAVDSRQLGELLSLNLRRIISAPDWSAEARDYSASGGPMIDLHIHDTDFIAGLLGKPQRVYTRGVSHGGAAMYAATAYDFGQTGPAVTCQAGAMAVGRPFRHEFEACFENATIAYCFANEPKGADPAKNESGSQRLTVYHRDGRIDRPTFEDADGFRAQLDHAARCAAANRKSDIIDAAIACDSLALIHAEIQSLKTGQPIDC